MSCFCIDFILFQTIKIKTDQLSLMLLVAICSLFVVKHQYVQRYLGKVLRVAFVLMLVGVVCSSEV